MTLTLEKYSRIIAPTVFGERFIYHQHIKQIYNRLQLLFCGRLPGGKKNLIINMPPRHGKTWSVEFFVSWAMGLNPRSKFIFTGNTLPRARRSSIEIKRIMRCPHYREIFPMSGIDKADTDAQDEWYLEAGGGMYAVGSTGSIIGFGAGSVLPGFYGAIIIDDPMKAVEARSETVRQSIIDNLTGGIMTRRNGEHTPIIMIMQRLHPLDPCGWVLENFDDWDQLVLPCVNPDGSLLWPGRISKDYLDRLRVIDEFTFYNQYQQSARLPGGNMIKEEWWGRWTQDDLNKCRGVFFTADTAYKKSKTADYSCISVWAYSPEAILLYDQVHGKWEWPDLVNQAKNLYERYRPTKANELRVGPIVIEDKASGTSLEQHLTTAGIETVAWSPKGKDKVFWAKQMLHGVYGNDGITGKSILLPRNAPWLDDFLKEAGEFSEDDSHAHDDRLNTVWIADDVWRNSGGIIGG